MRSSIAQLARLGRLPSEALATAPELRAFETALQATEGPLTDEEALALLGTLPSSEQSCFGMAWTVLHLIESAPGWPLRQAASLLPNPWIAKMLERTR